MVALDASPKGHPGVQRGLSDAPPTARTGAAVAAIPGSPFSDIPACALRSLRVQGFPSALRGLARAPFRLLLPAIRKRGRVSQEATRVWKEQGRGKRIRTGRRRVCPRH